MSLNLVSPGVKVREVDLTVGRIDAVNDQVGAIAGPFARGPIGVPVLVETEQDLLNTFGKPQNTDGQYEYWMTASSYLSYGGTLRVIRSDDDNLVNAHAGVAGTVLSLKIKSARRLREFILSCIRLALCFQRSRILGKQTKNLHH